jgi:hypothetical protein
MMILFFIFSFQDFVDNSLACRKHFEKLFEAYPNQCDSFICINLVEESGKESLLGDAFVEQLTELNRENVTYVQFDFHEHWLVLLLLLKRFLKLNAPKILFNFYFLNLKLFETNIA